MKVKSAVEINDWTPYFVFDPDDADHDVVTEVYLEGDVLKHPELCPKGLKAKRRIETTSVSKFDGPFLTTENTIYRLGTPSDRYLKMLESRKLTWSIRHPIPDCLLPRKVRVAA